MKPVATYSFLPWLRSGVANIITSADGDPAVKTRASIQVSLTLSGEPVAGGAPLAQTVAQDIALFGPGDIVGIDPRAVVRTEPHPLISNFEANYLAAIDSYDEDFPWRYTPARPDGLKLRPWIALVVLAEGEFKEGRNPASRPLPYITVDDLTVFPPAGDLWAWSHVHFNQSLAGSDGEIVSPDMSAVLPRVQSILDANPDLAYSRLICPRRLKDDTAYHAFVVPVFETGRLAGLGLDPTKAPNATASAWAAYGQQLEPNNFPIYYRWYFRTGTHGDFEYLVRLLSPQPVDKRVGTREMDVLNPGANLPGITNPELQGVLRLGGALQVPADDLTDDDKKERNKYDKWDQPYPHPFEKALAAFINLPDEYAAQTAANANATSGLGPAVQNDADPLITAPLYGRWHALTQRLLTQRDGTPAPNRTNWVHALNLDPRWRVPAGFGSDVVEENAEDYMNAAWEQIGDVLAANTRIRRLLLAREVSLRWYDRHLTPLAAANEEHTLALTAPLSSRILLNGVTLAQARSTSLVTPAYTSTAMRRVVRPGARLMRALPFTAALTPATLLRRVASREVSAAPPKQPPAGTPTVDRVSPAAEPVGIPPLVRDWLRRFPTLPITILIVSLLVALLFFFLGSFGIVLAIAAVAAGVYLYRLLSRWRTADAPALAISEAGQKPATVDLLPKSPDFTLSAPGSGVQAHTSGSDSPTAARFKTALRDSFTLIDVSKAVGAVVAPTGFDIAAAVATTMTAINPATTIPRRGLSVISIPSWIRAQLGDRFGEVMAYPKIDLPMYQPLKGGTGEKFLPNIHLIKPNSITLIETNQRFIEAYMVGLNHEFARKLLWREFPTDQRGSYFRQFWDPRSSFNPDQLTDQALKEKLYDIPELHRWAPESTLGTHNNRSGAAADAVLVIRGELLKRYPTAVIYAQRAKWEQFNPDGSIDLTVPRGLVDIPPDLEDKPPRTIVRTPMFEAKVDPDIYFFGFDLTIPEVKGGDGTNRNDDAGWFFVIKERPGEPRFGLELTRDAGNPEILEEVTWDDAGGGAFLNAGALTPAPLTAPPLADPEKKQPQFDDDTKANAASPSAARWAYILYRAPVMVAIHGSEMLGAGTSP